MKESFMRRAKVLGAGTLFAVGLTTSASALNYKIGDVDLRVDINTSAGVSVVASPIAMINYCRQ